MVFPQESFVYRSQGAHGNPSSEDYGWRASAGGRNQWLLATDNGVITELRDGRDWTGSTGSDLGNFYTLKMDNGSSIRCGHVQKGSFQVKKGDRVKKYQRLCRMGNSGTCFNGAYHTHMTFWDSSGRVVMPTRSGMLVYEKAIIYEGQTNMFEMESGNKLTFVGKPVERDRYKNQVDITVAVNARSNPNLGSSILGLWHMGIYDVLETVDMTHEQSNGFVWYRLRDGWCAHVYGVEYFKKEDKPIVPPTPPQNERDWYEVLEIAGRLELLARNNIGIDKERRNNG